MMLIQGNAFQIPLPDKSVHMGVTSPPYYSLRKYEGEQEFIFGGDKDCVHEWGEAKITKYQPTANPETSGLRNSKEMWEAREIQEIKEGQFCHKCNAWRGAYGLEPTLQMYVDHTVEWCREVWRVLRDDATFWLNLGDGYAGSGGAHTFDHANPGISRSAERDGVPKYQPAGGRGPEKTGTGLKPKDLMGVPWRVALALQADGWYLRSDIIWSKPNPMPESVTDRPTKAHEYLFLLTKNKKYFYDIDAVREKLLPQSIARISQPNFDNQTGGPKDPLNGGEGSRNRSARQGLKNLKEAHARGQGRNKRTVWTIPTAPYSGAHFATFPPALVEPCIKAGTSEKGVCPECGDPWKRIIVSKLVPTKKAAKTFIYDVRDKKGHVANDQGSNRQRDGHKPGYITAVNTLGWRPTCSHSDDLYRSEFPQARKARKRHQQGVTGYWWKRVRQRPGKDHWEVKPATVLDPFSGSGTTLLVARKLGRRGIGLDVAYQGLAKERLGLKALEEWVNGKPAVEEDYKGLPMFET